MNPPVRDAAPSANGIWHGPDGRASPTSSARTTRRILLEEKAKPYPASPSGMPGVQTLVPVMLDHVAAGRLSLARFVDLSSAGPARILASPEKGGSRLVTTPT